MDDTDKLIKAIHGHLPKLNAKRLRLVLLLIYEFIKVPATR